MAGRIVPEGGWQHRLKPQRTPRVKSEGHLAFVRRLPCVCCATGDVRGAYIACDPMHVRTGSMMHGKDPAGGGQTSDDRWTLPGCRTHHDEQHDGGNEMAFWRRYGIDAHLLALVLWGLSGDHHAACNVIALHARKGG